MTTKVGIIVLTFATPHWQADINRVLSSLEHINYPKESLELICVESQSPDHTRVKEWFESAWMTKSGQTLPRISYLFRDEVIGFAGNNNIGFEKARELGCEYVYLLNEDAEADPDFLLKAVERAEGDKKIAYVQSLILLGDRERVNTIGNAFHFLGFGYSNGYLWSKAQAIDHLNERRKSDPELEIGYLSGAGVLGRVSLIEQCGLFDPEFFMYHEDTDATFQARIRGFKTVIEPTSVVYHHYEFAKSMSKYYLMEKNRWAMVFSYYRLWSLMTVLPLFLAMELALLGFSLKRGWWKEKKRVYREVFNRRFWQWIAVRRKKIQAERVISDAELFRSMVATVKFQGEDVSNPLLTHIGNPVMRAYWWIVQRLVV